MIKIKKDRLDKNDSVLLNSQTISGKLMKTANNIGGNYGVAIITKLVQMASEAEKNLGGNVKKLNYPLSYGVLHPDFSIRSLHPFVGENRLEELYQQILHVRQISLDAVSEYYDINADNFNLVGLSKNDVIESVRLYWTELDDNGNRIPSKHSPTHALAMIERRPSEPLLEEVISSSNNENTKNLQKLKNYHSRIEKTIPYHYYFKLKEPNSLQKDNIIKI
tara:strand:- start:304 stop:966 length:663 start_codon:yes stop_codon:yes gene_type:complete